MVSGAENRKQRFVVRVTKMIAKMATPQDLEKFLEAIFRRAAAPMQSLKHTVLGCAFRFSVSLKLDEWAAEDPGNPWIHRARKLLERNQFDLSSLHREIEPTISENWWKSRLTPTKEKTDSPASEKGVRQMLGSVVDGDGILMADFDGLIFWADKNAKKLLGVRHFPSDSPRLTDFLDFSGVRPRKPSLKSPHTPPPTHDFPTSDSLHLTIDKVPVFKEPQNSSQGSKRCVSAHFFSLKCSDIYQIFSNPSHSQGVVANNWETFRDRFYFGPGATRGATPPPFLLLILRPSSPESPNDTKWAEI